MAARVLLFGGSGFIGRHVAEMLRVDERMQELIWAGRSQATAWNCVRHDLLADSAEVLADLLRRTAPDVVINCTGRIAGSTTELVAANATVTARLLDAMTTAASPARLVLLGSAAEYGVVPHGAPVVEDGPQQPISAYGVSKLAGTQLARLAATAGVVDAVVLRIFNPIGPGVGTDTVVGTAAARIRAAMAAGMTSVHLGPLAAKRDFVDVRDVATAVTTVAFARDLKESVLNVGSGVATATRAVVHQLADVAGYRGAVVETAGAPSRSRAVDWIAADTDRIEHSTGWSPAYDLASTIRASWEG